VVGRTGTWRASGSLSRLRGGFTRLVPRILCFVPFLVLSALCIFHPLGYQIRLSRGTSMMPEFSYWDISLVEIPPRAVRVGDVVLARVGDHIVGHRVVAVQGDLVIMHGDNNPPGDFEYVSRDSVIARVVVHSPAWIFFSLYCLSFILFGVGAVLLGRWIADSGHGMSKDL